MRGHPSLIAAGVQSTRRPVKITRRRGGQACCCVNLDNTPPVCHRNCQSVTDFTDLSQNLPVSHRPYQSVTDSSSLSENAVT